MKKLLGLLIVFMFINSHTFAQKLYFPQFAVTDSVALVNSMPALAQSVIINYRQEKDRRVYFSNLFMLQMIIGKYSNALNSIDSIRTLNRAGHKKYPELSLIQYEIFCNSKLQETIGALSFKEEFNKYFKIVHDTLDDKAALYISTAFKTRNGIEELRQNLQNSLNIVKMDSLNLNDAINLCRNYNLFQVYKIIENLAKPLLAIELSKRYIIQDSVMIKTTDGVYINARVARRREVTLPQTAILQYTIYASPYPVGLNMLLDPVTNGYIGIVAYSRGKGYSPDEIVPYEHDGKDVYDVIEWITKQPWSNGKVGMFGGSYNGFTQWASAKHLHPALQTIVPSASAAPGLDVPMTNNVFMSFVFPWIYYVTDTKYLDINYYNETKIWDSVNSNWYASGKPYHSLDSILGRPNQVFQRWLQHPGYDKYWQDMIPYKDEFSKINIPVLTTTGYYDGGQIGAMYYYREHIRYNKNANHYLLIGPYGHFGSQSSPDMIYNGYRIDPVANISIHDVIYQWFDYILKDSVRPPMLKDKINYEVMGSNEWKHSPTLSAMTNDTLKLYLSNNISASNYELSEKKPLKIGYIPQTVNFADRTTINNYSYENQIIYDSLDVRHGISFISEPFKAEMNINGAFWGELNASINKKDMDFSLTLFELMPDGKYFYLSYFMGRASYAKDKSNRQLLIPGKMESIPFWNSYLTSKKISKGSRLVIVLNISKSPDQQINYGTGKDVSDETIKDAKTSLQIKWQNDSFIKIPIGK